MVWRMTAPHIMATYGTSLLCMLAPDPRYPLQSVIPDISAAPQLDPQDRAGCRCGVQSSFVQPIAFSITSNRRVLAKKPWT